MGDDAPRRAPSVLLAIDTSLGGVSVCVMRGGAPEAIATESQAMERGHADALLPIIDRVVSALEGGFGALSRVAVATGPGSFTGIRVGVAAARAIGLACKIPVVGVSTLAALAAPAIATTAGFFPTIAAAVDARHGNVYVQSFSASGETQLAPAAMTAADAIRAIGPGPVRLVGSGAPMMAIEAWSAGINADIDDGSVLADILFVARLGWLADPARARPQPFYLKPPDAKPPSSGVFARRD